MKKTCISLFMAMSLCVVPVSVRAGEGDGCPFPFLPEQWSCQKGPHDGTWEVRSGDGKGRIIVTRGEAEGAELERIAARLSARLRGTIPKVENDLAMFYHQDRRGKRFLSVVVLKDGNFFVFTVNNMAYVDELVNIINKM